MRRICCLVGFLTLVLGAPLGAQDLESAVRPLWDRFQSALGAGDTGTAHESLEAALAAIDAADPRQSDDTAAWWRWQFGEAALFDPGSDTELCVRTWTHVVDHWEHVDRTEVDGALGALQTARGRLATAYQRRHDGGDIDKAEELRELVVADWEGAGEAHQAALARVYLGQMLVLEKPDERGLDGLAELQKAQATLLETATGTADLAWTARMYANSLRDMGQEFDERVLTLQFEALKIYTGLIEEKSRALHDAKQRLEEWKRAVAANPAAVRDGESNLADLQHEVEQREAEVFQLRDSDFRLRWETANSLQRHGRLFEARNLARQSCEESTELYGDDDLETTWPRSFYASILADSGDAKMALEFSRQVLDIRVKSLGAAHTDLMMAWNSYGHNLMLSSPPRWQEAIDALLKAVEARDPADQSLVAQTNYAATLDNLGTSLAEVGETKRGIEMLQESLDTVRSPVSRAQAQGGMAMALQREGRFPEAARYFELAIPVVRATQGYRQPLYFLRRQAMTLAALGDRERLLACLDQLLEISDEAIRYCYQLPGRPAYELATIVDTAAQQVLALCDTRFKIPKADADRLQQRAFEILESLRCIELRVANITARLPDNPEVQRLLLEARRARAKLSSSVALGTGDDSEIREQVETRDRAEGAALSAMQLADLPVTRITLQAIADALPDRTAVVAYRVVTLVTPDRKDPGRESRVEQLEAHIVTRSGRAAKFERVQLKDLDRIRRAAIAWNEDITGRSVDRSASDGGSKPAKPDSELAKLVFAPIKNRLKSATKLIVCLDDELHTVPIELLDGANKLELRFATSLTDLVAPGKRPLASHSLFAVGDIDYDNAPDVEPAQRDRGRAATPAADRAASWRIAGPDRSLPPFDPLTSTKEELTKLDSFFVRRFGKEAEAREILTDRAATLDAVMSGMSGHRYLHFATHGYFRRMRDDELRSEAVRGFAPMSMCGLALTGANRGKDGYLGVITGEELAGVDLSGCELAVMSACESYLGEMRAGHGLASLQGALHAAGARIVLATRWKVPDADAADFITEFYRSVWIDGSSPRDALVYARSESRERGAPMRAWAGFVLTGDLRDNP